MRGRGQVLSRWEAINPCEDSGYPWSGLLKYGGVVRNGILGIHPKVSLSRVVVERLVSDGRCDKVT